MQWIHDFQLFLFDFDGLLVNTEHLHYQAYVNVLAKRGYRTSLSFANFFELAHLNATAWKEALFANIANLDVSWERLYEEKKEEYRALLASGKVELMEGVEPLLKALDLANIQRCVVTHSTMDQVEPIRSQIPILKTISKWITREDYEKPKPNPECYLKAIALYGKKGDRIIGFEDSLRGLSALKNTPALAVLICPEHHPLLQMALQDNALHFSSFAQIFSDKLRSD